MSKMLKIRDNYYSCPNKMPLEEVYHYAKIAESKKFSNKPRRIQIRYISGRGDKIEMVYMFEFDAISCEVDRKE